MHAPQLISITCRVKYRHKAARNAAITPLVKISPTQFLDGASHDKSKPLAYEAYFPGIAPSQYRLRVFDRVDQDGINYLDQQEPDSSMQLISSAHLAHNARLPGMTQQGRFAARLAPGALVALPSLQANEGIISHNITNLMFLCIIQHVKICTTLK